MRALHQLCRHTCPWPCPAAGECPAWCIQREQQPGKLHQHRTSRAMSVLFLLTCQFLNQTSVLQGAELFPAPVLTFCRESVGIHPCSFAAVKSCSLFPRKRLPEMVLELAEWHSPRETCRRAYLCSRRFWKGPEEAPAKWFLKSQLQVVPPALKQHLCHKEETKSSCGDNCDQCWGLEPFKTWLTFNKLSQGRV